MRRNIAWGIPILIGVSAIILWVLRGSLFWGILIVIGLIVMVAIAEDRQRRRGNGSD